MDNLSPGTSDAIEAALTDATSHGEQGVQVAAYRQGRLAVNAWTGWADSERTTHVTSATLFPVFSVTKSFTAVAVHVLAEQGLVDYDQTIRTYWPEYGQNGKDEMTVRHVLTHQAGVPQMPQDVTLERMCDWDWMVRALELEEPIFRPGTRSAYMGYTYGFILGELIQRVDPTHRPFGQFLREEVCGPLAIDSFWVGIPQENRNLVATLVNPEPAPLPPDDSPNGRAAPSQVAFVPELYNDPRIQQACIPATNGIGNAGSVARLFAMLANLGELDGVRLLAEARVQSFLEPRPGGDDEDMTLGFFMPVGMGGFLLDPMGYVRPDPEARVLCQYGAGGTLGYADLNRQLAFAICHNRMFRKPPDVPLAEPFLSLGDAVRA